MDAKRELERIANEIWFDEDGYERKGDYRKDLVQTILEKLPELVEIDKEKLLKVLKKLPSTHIPIMKDVKTGTVFYYRSNEDILEVIVSANPIRVKEGK